ncbi:TIGR03619 family F420-dependent LLM class oxidoreductase [Acidiferrimicrobium sp. IK]|uniref:TIGR03619 family F420-dependent LLM class oxidoreductase n=1 Tax=Acidiferrimicrobium sp. IK TaxID=2871700 RepID=UPI0021CAFEFA|nr:TIGR03619 family F420-dependent LLM class oxidoreductase [Acidiferrimicrobium sp. IK]MCU4186643.1 TIGR03619 family F420-dependent LLM class oxidoreductase [Acidiferrimicrobium sp. IK]
MDVCFFARPNLAPGGDPAAFLDIARLADAAGLHSICFGEHLAMSADTDRYPYGPWRHGPDTAWMDPLITLSAVAGVTERIRLSTAILLAPLRPGLVLAKEVATLDVISGGRVELGLGTGWQAAEYRGVGLEWDQRQRRFDEVIDVCRLAWGPQPFSLPTSGGTETLTALPTPVQQRIPLYYGVKASQPNAARIARFGDGWSPVGVRPDDVRRGVSTISAEFDKAGRDPAGLVVRIPLPAVLGEGGGVDVRATFEASEEFIEAGATMFVCGFDHRLRSLDEAAELIGGYAEAGRGLTV